MLSTDVYKIPWEIFLQVAEIISSAEKTVHVNMQFEELLLKKIFGERIFKVHTQTWTQILSNNIVIASELSKW